MTSETKYRQGDTRAFEHFDVPQGSWHPWTMAHAHDCPASGGDKPETSCYTCMHVAELKTLTVADVLDACNEIDQRWGRNRPKPTVHHGFAEGTTVFQALEYLANLRSSMRIGEVRRNAATCHGCGQTIESKTVHDFRTCKCGNVSVDGGSHYAKRNFRSPGDPEAAPWESDITNWPGTYLAAYLLDLRMSEEYETMERRFGPHGR